MTAYTQDRLWWPAEVATDTKVPVFRVGVGWGGVGRKTYACVNLALVSKALSLMATGRERLQWHDVTHAPLHHAGAAIVATRTAGLQPACGRCCGCCGCRSSTLVHAIDGGDVLLHKSIVLALQSDSGGCERHATVHEQQERT